MSEPTAALSFSDLITEVAVKLGAAYYGANGDEAAQVPVNVHDLNDCKKHVNNGIRMFLSDAPSNGWRCQHPVADVVLWPSVVVETVATVAWVTATAYAVGDKVLNAGESYVCLVAHTSVALFATDLTAGNWRETRDCTGVYEPATDTTLITASTDTFYASMELKSIVVTDIDTLTITAYASATTVRVAGDHHWTGAKTFSITADGNYTLPATFGGETNGDITYVADTNSTLSITWTSDVEIRRLREDLDSGTGDPYRAAIRVTATSRRWELIVWPIPTSARTVEFPYELYFNKLVNLTDLHPCGFAHDETIKAAIFAVMERDAEDTLGGLMEYYVKKALPSSYKIDGRQGPRRLGSMNRKGDITQHNFRNFQRRPIVTYDTP